MLLSLRAYAKHRGCALSAVQKAIKTGRISLVNGQVDPDQADRDWTRNSDPAKQPVANLTGRQVVMEPEAQPHGGWLKRERAIEDPESEAAAGDYLKARADKERYQAELKRLELEEREGSLINAAEAEAAWANMISAARAKLLGIGAALAPEVAIETNAAVCQSLIQAAIHEALYELSGSDIPDEPDPAGNPEGAEALGTPAEPDGQPVVG